MPTGSASGIVVLDIDVKRAGKFGFDTLAELGFAILPDTPLAHTPSGGLHVYFRAPDHLEVRNTEGDRGSGIGLGLDWRGTGGYVILPDPGGGYWWDPHHNLDTEPLADAPSELLPKVRAQETLGEPMQPTSGLSPYAEAALLDACNRIVTAPGGVQEATLHCECFSIGTLAGAKGIPEDFALRALLRAGLQMRDYDHRRPWRSAEVQKKVSRSFSIGLSHPRASPNG